jgi:class 3 adenylate cyclase/predicted ATPase
LAPLGTDASTSAQSPALEQSLHDAGGPAERRQLTVLFCDLVGSTEMSSRLDPEDLRTVIGTYHQCVADTISEFDGFIARFMGDGALVYFGYPHGHEDNAARAIHAALALVANVGKLTALDRPLRVRIGVATGLVVVGELVNAGAAREQTALGESPNLAARLHALAEPGAIIISDNTHRLAGDAFAYINLGKLSIKGFDAPVHIWQVTGTARTPDSYATLRPERVPRKDTAAGAGHAPLVGRVQELGLLRDGWGQVTEGQGRVVLLMGDPGIGKSRLVQALIDDVASEPHALLELRGSEYHANSPLYPVISLLWSVLDWSRGDSDEARLDKLAAFCAHYQVSPAEGVPLLMSLLSLPPSPRFPLPAMSPERQKQRTLQTLLGAVLSLGGERPVLAVVEDLHWIDPTTMELLKLLVDQVPTVRLFLLLTARFEFRPPWPLHAHVAPIVLTRLTRRQAEEMVGSVSGGKELPPDALGQIVAKADGVPLYVEELTMMVLESAMARPSDEGQPLAGSPPGLAIPATLQDSLTARLDRLAGAKGVAQLCAALGREFSYALLTSVSTVDEPQLQRGIAQLIDAEFLYQRGTPPDAVYVFKHALIQEAAYHSMLKSVRHQHHQRIAQAMVTHFSAEAAAQPEYVAMHFTEAGDVVTAVQWWQRAGRRAFTRATYTEAGAHFAKGLSLLTSMPESVERDQRELEFEVELGYALIPVRGWAAAETARAFTRAGELCRRIGDLVVQFRALWGLGAFHFVRGDQHQARQVADQCLHVARQAKDVDALMEAHYLSGIVSCVMGDCPGGQRDLEEAIRIYGTDRREAHRILYGQDVKASALGWLAMARWVCGRPDEALDRANEALAFIRDTTQPFLLARGLAGVGFVHVFRGDPQGPDSALQAALSLCAEQRFAYFHAVVSAFHGANLVHLGKTQEGVSLMEKSVRALRTVGSELLFTVIFTNLASAHLALAQVDEGLAAVDDGLECAERTGERWAEADLHRVRGQLLLARGSQEATQAEKCFERAMEVARRQRAMSYELRAATSLAKLWIQQGREGEARTLLNDVVGGWPKALDTVDLRVARQLQGLV